ncbi:hypothetical protein C8F01DRAFT_1234309, partial [Mycena amicta]
CGGTHCVCGAGVFDPNVFGSNILYASVALSLRSRDKASRRPQKKDNRGKI